MSTKTVACGGRYGISEVASRTKFSAPTLRYYERMGLIPAPERTSAGYRSYDDEHLRILDFVGRAKRLGLPLEAIRCLVDAWTRRDCPETRKQLIDLLEAKLDEVQRAIHDLVAFAEQLEDVHGALLEAPARSSCGPQCGCVVDVSSVEPGGFQVRRGCASRAGRWA